MASVLQCVLQLQQQLCHVMARVKHYWLQVKSIAYEDNECLLHDNSLNTRVQASLQRIVIIKYTIMISKKRILMELLTS